MEEKALNSFSSGVGQDFRVTRIAPDVYSILDAGDSSFYVVVGEKKAAVIDTGVTPGGQIRPLIRQITDKEPVLILTHAHVDHMYHMDEFTDCEVFLNHRDAQLPEDFLRGMMGGKDLYDQILHTSDMVTGTEIDLGGNILKICTVPGHTPGSSVILETRGNNLFTGDAIGSGCGVWLQVPCAVPLDQYLESLLGLQKWLVDQGGRMKFQGGHNYQIFQSTLIPSYNPLSMGLLADLIDLVDGLVQGTIVGRASNVDKVMGLEPPLYASFGRAEIQYLPGRIHS